MTITMTEVREFVTMVGVLIAAASLAFTALNTWTTGKTNRARFWLDLRSAFSKHDVVHFNLRPGGIWTDGNGPQTAHEWALVDAYMGLFEHCEIMLKEALIDLPTFKAIYGYRLHNILANGPVRQGKLVSEAEYWTLFLALTERMRSEGH